MGQVSGETPASKRALFSSSTERERKIEAGREGEGEEGIRKEHKGPDRGASRKEKAKVHPFQWKKYMSGKRKKRSPSSHIGSLPKAAAPRDAQRRRDRPIITAPLAPRLVILLPAAGSLQRTLRKSVPLMWGSICLSSTPITISRANAGGTPADVWLRLVSAVRELRRAAQPGGALHLGRRIPVRELPCAGTEKIDPVSGRVINNWFQLGRFGRRDLKEKMLIIPRKVMRRRDEGDQTSTREGKRRNGEYGKTRKCHRIGA